MPVDYNSNAATNAHEYSVSELAQTLKRTIEDTFGHVRVRGELGRVTIAKSGHCYLDVKDDKAVINSIIWKGQMSRLSMLPEEGMEVICEGKLTTYPGRSNYQLVISKMELAGAGALMALFEKRKTMLAAEGLFDQARKVELPFMPKTIGVVTSPTGSVIRDILHRIEDRFPSHVLVWPVLVQGDKAAAQIAGAITGFNHAEGFPRPDVLIVARGGGSLEDLWCFNEEVVVRAAAASNIPLIAAVGHETDWTLIDYAADYRAPTPTGAAEVAVPVRADWLTTLEDYGLRLTRGLQRNTREKTARLSGARLPRLDTVLAAPRQRLDLAVSKLPSLTNLFSAKAHRLQLAKLPPLGRITERPAQRLHNISMRLRPTTIQHKHSHLETALSGLSRRANTQMKTQLEGRQARLERAGKLLTAYSYQGVLERGFAIVQDADGGVVKTGAELSSGQGVELVFADGHRSAVIDGEGAIAPLKVKPKTKPKKAKPPAANTAQADLF
ncbi:MAG: exodeoxyribonuclease VII large subunit [Maricaulaceae bacterium]